MTSRPTIFTITGSILMMLMLLWLTVSIPVVNACMQQKAKQEKKMNTSSPLAGSEEEKAPCSPSTNAATEYLHENEELQHDMAATVTMYNSHKPSVYIAFHGELVSPPPEI